MDNNSQKNKRIARNTMFLYFRMFFVLIVSLYVSRAILGVLGAEDFGTYNVVAGFVSLFAFFEATLSGSVQRFYNYNGTKTGPEGYSNVYSAAIVMSLAFAVIMVVILEAAGMWYINRLLVVEDDRFAAAGIIFHLSVFSFALKFIELPFSSLLMAKERMDFYAFMSILEVLSKLAIAFILPHVSSDKLVFYGSGIAVISLLITCLYILYVVIQFRDVKFRLPVSLLLLKQICSFSGWTILGSFAFMTKGQGVNMLLNYFFGPVINAARAIAYQVFNAVSGFSSNIVMAFRPQIVNEYATGNLNKSVSLVFSESRICYTLLLVLIVPLSLESDYILRLWLGSDVPQYTGTFMILVLIDSLLAALNAPCTQIVFASGKIISYQIFSSIVNILLIPICYLLLRLSCGPNSVFVAAIGISVINQAVCLIVASRVCGFSIGSYLHKVLLPCCILSCTLPIIPFLLTLLLEQSFWRLVCTSMVSLVVGVVISYWAVFSKSERQFIVNSLKKIKSFSI